MPTHTANTTQRYSECCALSSRTESSGQGVGTVACAVTVRSLDPDAETT